MVKRTLSFVLALTVLVSCLMGIPVMATTADVITDITAGGEYAVKTIMSADDLFKAANFSANGITATRESGKTAITFDANARYNNDITLADFSNVDLSEAMAPGKRVVSLTGTVNLSRLPEAYKLDGYKKIYENFGFGILATTSENATLQYGRFYSMRVRSTDDTEKDEETGVETTNGKYNVYVGDPALAIISDDWTQPDTIELKWDFIFTDNAANDGSKDITLQVSGRKQGATEWVVYTPCEANEEEEIAARVLPVKTVPAGKKPFKNIKMSYSVNGSPLTEEGASTGVTGLIAGIKDPLTMTLGGFDMVMEAKTDAEISDLGGKSYEAGAVVPFSFVLPEGYKSAKISVGGVDVKTLDNAAGAYKANLNLSEVSAVGEVEITLSGVGADDATFSKTTKIYIPKSSAINNTLLTTPVVGGHWNDRVVMDNDAFLNRSYTPSSVTYAYDSDAKTASMSVSTSDNYKKFLDLSNLEMNTETSGEVEVYMTVQPTKVSEDNWFPSASTSSYWCLYLDSYIDGTRVQGAVDKWKGLTTKYTSSGVKVYWPANGAANPVTWSETTKIPMKFVITKNNGALTMKHYADLGNGWVDGGANLTSTAASGSLTGLGFRFGSNSKSGQIKYVISDAKIVEKTPKTAHLKAVCDDETAKEGKATVDFVLPVGFREAELTIDGVQAAFFGADTAAGAYTADVKLNAIDKDAVSVVLSGVLGDGSKFAKEVTLSIPKLGAGSLDEEMFTAPTYSTERQIMSEDEFLAGKSMSAIYDKNTQTATLKGNDVLKMTDLGEVFMNGQDEGVVEISMKVAPTGDWSELYASSVTSSYAQWILRLNPYIDGKMVACASGNNQDYAGLSVTRRESAETARVEFPRNSSTNNKLYTSGMEIPIKLVIEKKDGVITATNWVDINNTGDWKMDANVSATYTIPDGENGDITGVGFRFGSNSSPGGTIKWVISDAKVIEKAISDAKIYSSVSDMVYMQNDTGKVPVEIYLPEDYKEAYVKVDGVDVAEFTSLNYAAGFYKSEISLEKLDGVGTHEIALVGKMADGTAFEKATAITIYAATEGADAYALELEEPEMKSSVSSGTRSEYADQTSVWETYNANTNPNGPFLSQYVVELGADVDFTNGIPGIYLTGNRAQKGDNYNFGEFFEITNLGQTAFMMADGSSVAIPQKKFNLTFRVMIDRPESGYGDTFNIYVYIDGNYAGLIQKTNASYSLGDLYGALSIGFRTNEADAPVSVSKLTWKKYSTISASAELESAKKVVVTFNKDMAEMSDEFITLVDKAGNPVAAEVVVSGKTATITAANYIPAYASVKIGTGVKEADYEFRAYTGTSESTKTRLGEALSKGFEIALGNKPTKTAVYGMTVEKDGNNIVTEVELYALAAETIGKLVVAGYDDNGVMQGIDIQDVATEEEGEAILTLTAEFDGTFASYKAFLWSDVSGTMIPILPVK